MFRPEAGNEGEEEERRFEQVSCPQTIRLQTTFSKQPAELVWWPHTHTGGEEWIEES